VTTFIQQLLGKNVTGNRDFINLIMEMEQHCS
jgi:hypothetical protein